MVQYNTIKSQRLNAFEELNFNVGKMYLKNKMKTVFSICLLAVLSIMLTFCTEKRKSRNKKVLLIFLTHLLKA